MKCSVYVLRYISVNCLNFPFTSMTVRLEPRMTHSTHSAGEKTLLPMASVTIGQTGQLSVRESDRDMLHTAP